MEVSMFLKSIKMQGFKSFADKVTINFNDSVTGIVGPNGCGKSNISDAIRWVLGEQSVKQMRGTSMTDVIFSGSETRRRVNLAEVTLVFNNENKALNSDYEEVEITRRLYRDTRESEYLINKVPCRLRDIHDLVMDTGLGRDSLSIISQGSISYFAEAKPLDRRVIFEEAAGVSKYKRRKLESIRKLERTQENIERMQDIVDEIKRQVKPLKKAAEKANIYIEKRDALKQIEVSVLVKEIDHLNQNIKTSEASVFNLETEIANLETRIGVFEHDLEEKRSDTFNLDQKIVKSQEEIMSLVHEIGILETRKVEIEEKRKYALETGDSEVRAKEIYASLQDAKLEYEERLNRHEELKRDTGFMSDKNQELNRSLNDLTQQLDFINAQHAKLNNRKELLEHRLNRPFEMNEGVQTIMENIANLYGIHDVVGNILIPSRGYETAISTPLSGALMHIVTENDEAAVGAIQFLKQNESGRATFIPLNVLRPRFVHRDILTVAKHAEGFLGVAEQFVNVDDQYISLKENLLGNVLIVDTVDNANQLARRVNYNVRIVTLDGDIIHQGGQMTGGRSRKNQTSTYAIKQELESIEKQLDKFVVESDALSLELNQTKQALRSNNDTLMQKRIALAQIEPLLDVKRAKYERLQSDYDALEADKSGHEDIQDSLVLQLNQALMRRDELTSNLSLDRERRLQISDETHRKEQSLRGYRRDLSEKQEALNQIKMHNLKFETQIENTLSRLSSEYQMTYEFALENIYDVEQSDKKDLVLKLRQEIQALGNVNLDAPEEYEAVNERYEFLNKQLQDLSDSREKLLNVIHELDEIMEVQFIDMFNRINDELQTVFKKLFNGGRARLVLEQPDDILNTGVDIDVQPPGKSVQNIRLFSGGEKSLIAISVLFSIINARHVPLCIFDEVEAALDQVNVERLASYIQELADDTQFILITHRPGTMARCDKLYGVTMPTQGVSSLLSVRLDEAIELREES